MSLLKWWMPRNWGAQGVDISFLSEEAQQWVEVIIEKQGCNVSNVQSGKLKEYGKSGELTLAMVRLILTEEKPKERKVTLKADKIGKYFQTAIPMRRLKMSSFHFLINGESKGLFEHGIFDKRKRDC